MPSMGFSMHVFFKIKTLSKIKKRKKTFFTSMNKAYHPAGVGKSSNGLPGCKLRLGAFTRVGWQVTL